MLQVKHMELLERRKEEGNHCIRKDRGRGEEKKRVSWSCYRSVPWSDSVALVNAVCYLIWNCRFPSLNVLLPHSFWVLTARCLHLFFFQQFSSNRTFFFFPKMKSVRIPHVKLIEVELLRSPWAHSYLLASSPLLGSWEAVTTWGFNNCS